MTSASPRAASVVAVAALLLLVGCSPAPTSLASPVGHGEMRFVGSWSGPPDDDGDGVLSMVVRAAAPDGTTFDGDLTFATGGTETTARVLATMTPHGHLVAGIGDATASLEAHITDPATLDYCFVRYGVEPVYTCGRLVRED